MTTTMPYAIRRLHLADVPEMVSIIVSARFEFDVHRRTQSLLKPSDQDLYTTYQEPRSDYFVATRARIIAGGAGIAPLTGSNDETCELQRMYVDARHRGMGVGRLLLNECLRRAVLMGFRRCYAQTISEMGGAIRFYEANGFRRLEDPLGTSGNEYIDCWLLKDLT
jgi:putative acetyltransferase